MIAWKKQNNIQENLQEAGKNKFEENHEPRLKISKAR
jgi:hypothetical protein